jgi:hypothetical protein
VLSTTISKRPIQMVRIVIVLLIVLKLFFRKKDRSLLFYRAALT